MNFTSHYETEHCNLQGHSSFTTIYLYIHKVNFGVQRVITSYSQLEINHEVEYKFVNFAFICDADCALVFPA